MAIKLSKFLKVDVSHGPSLMCQFPWDTEVEILSKHGEYWEVLSVYESEGKIVIDIERRKRG